MIILSEGGNGMRLVDIKNPQQLKALTYPELDSLCTEIRSTVISTVSKNGGHLSSNLGDVEITLALHRVLNCPEDKIVFDVGHQCYAHKLITGRYDAFDTLRKTDGICGFPRREESEYDCFSTGHASNSISVALGMARARDLRGDKHKIAVIIGDGALTGGMAFEALNDAGNSKTQLMIILNDNGMSISGNVGAVNNYLSHLRLSKGWQNLKKSIGNLLLHIPLAGKRLYNVFQSIKNRIRNIFIHDRLFSALGIRYFGPVDGSNIKAMEAIMQKMRELDGPCLLHVYTQKGCGFRPAEDRPDLFHGTPPFRMDDGKIYRVKENDFGAVACDELIMKAKEDPSIAVVTAAMSYGTGMQPFQTAFPERLFDVGIAEEHAVTMASGLALGGMKPFVAIYDSFLQRAFDQITEDAAMQHAHVCFLCDRAGIGSSDGSSHHGTLGTSYLSCIPGLTLLAPANTDELRRQIGFFLDSPCSGPWAIMYPKEENKALSRIDDHFEFGKWQYLRKGSDAVLISYSSLLSQAIGASDLLEKKHIHLGVINASTLKPLDSETLSGIKVPIFIAEENVDSGSLGDAICRYLISVHLTPPRRVFSCGDRFIPHGSHDDLLKSVRLDAVSLAEQIEKEITA